MRWPMAETSSEPGDESRPEWYADGLQFACTQCGNCCTGPLGYVSFTEEEGAVIARELGLEEDEFYEQYAHKISGQWSLIEKHTKHGYDCIFLDRESVPDKAICSLYESRPGQCRTWPFWPENLESREIWEETRRQTPCPGMNTGTLVPIEAIRIQRDAHIR